jgi:hypothetical protein
MSACSLVFVQEPTQAMLTKRAPLTCTASQTWPITDLAIGAILGTAVFSATYAAVDRFNEECASGQCYRPWGPGLIAAFLTVTPSWMSSAIGFVDTHRCRKAVRSQRNQP